MSDPFIGMIITVGFNFAPAGYHICDGSTLSISQNNALFALLGTQFGGNGSTTFNLPNLQGRVPVGTGQLSGGGTYVIGQNAGTENVTLQQTQMPVHTHVTTVSATTVKASLSLPSTGVVLAKTIDAGGTDAPDIYAPSGTSTTVALGGVNTAAAGGSQPFSVLQPYLALTQAIALQGIFPSRS